MVYEKVLTRPGVRYGSNVSIYVSKRTFVLYYGPQESGLLGVRVVCPYPSGRKSHDS